MIPERFAYHSVTTLREALDLLQKYENAKVIAGGQSLIPMMKFRILSPAHLIDIGGIKNLSYIRMDGHALLIGALTKHSDIEYSALAKHSVPILAETASQIADPQVRNLGTIGGSICHADPAADWPATLLVLGTTFTVVGKKERSAPVEDFFTGPFSARLDPGEILTEIQVPQPPARRVGQAYVKFERRAGDFATVGVAANVAVSDDDTVEGVKIAFSSVAPAAFRVARAEDTLIGKKATPNLLEEAAQACSDQSAPTADLRGSVEYKRQMVKVFAVRALRIALGRAGISEWGQAS